MYKYNVHQKLMECKNMTRLSFKLFVDDLIIENAKIKNDQFSLFACNLSHQDKKLFLSYLISPEDFEDFTSNTVREKAAIKDYEEDMQFVIDSRIDDLFSEIRYDQRREQL